MRRSSTVTGLIVAVAAALAFGMSGPFIKPLLEAGWSPAAAVIVRSLIGGLVLAPLALVALRGRWHLLWGARKRILLIGLIGSAATQLAYFASIERIPVSTGILIEFMAPLLLVGFVWFRTRRTPGAVVLFGSVFAVIGLVMVVSPGERDHSTRSDSSSRRPPRSAVPSTSWLQQTETTNCRPSRWPRSASSSAASPSRS